MTLQEAISEARKQKAWIYAKRPFTAELYSFSPGLFSAQYMEGFLEHSHIDYDLALDSTMWDICLSPPKLEENVTPVTTPSTALKYDSKKPRMELLSVPALIEISKVLTYGADKYTVGDVSGAHNWRKGFEWSRLYGAALRHLTAHMDGDDTDPESGLSHLAHLGCCVMFLLEHEIDGLGTDDRYKSEDTE